MTEPLLIDDAWLARLRCPEDHSTLRRASVEEVEALNAAIRSGELRNVGGEAVTLELSEALVRAAGDRAYPVWQGVPRLLIEEALPLATA